VTVGLRRVGDFAELRVANTGPGIPAEVLPRVFDRFFRGDASHGSAVEGSGLGLSIAQWVVHAHEGRIRVESGEDGLTTVTVTLPLPAA
jgi:signal transduction histidine kinase